MPTPAEIIKTVASLQNDTAQSQYTSDACLPYFNLALGELQELYQLNDIPIIHKVSSPIINCPAGTTTISFGGIPALPSDLIEIEQLWESPEGLNQPLPMARKGFISHYLEGNPSNRFLIWAWIGGEIKLAAANQDIDLTIDYTKNLFNTITINQVDTELGAKYTSIKQFLSYKTAALCSMFIGENETRALALNNEALSALNRALQIPIKGSQQIMTLRRPYRAGYKSRGRS